LGAIFDISELLEKSMRAVISYMHMDRGMIMLVDESTQSIYDLLFTIGTQITSTGKGINRVN